MGEEEQWLPKSGWHIKPQALLAILNHLSEDDPSMASSRTTQPHYRDAIIAQLLDSDLKHVGSPCLPDASSLQRISRLQGPLVLQVVSVRNICQSSSKSLLRYGNDQHGRLLRIHLTDGCTVISAIEYHPMPAFSLDVAPGTKVKLENTVSVQNGFLLGDARSFTILGGHVPALYESWEMERKYSGLVHMTGLKSARVEGDGGPPPFHGLHVPRLGKFESDKKPSVVQQSQQQGVHLKDPARRSLHKKEVTISSSKDSEHLGHQGIAEMSNNIMSDSLSSSRSMTSGASSSHQVESKIHLEDKDVPLGKSADEDVRKDAIKAVLALGVETAPLQNREAAQKLLDKRTDFHSRKEPGRGGRGGRGRGRRGDRQQEEATFTLDEWEAKKGVSNLSNNQAANTCDDEFLARRLHYQLNVEGIGHERTGEAHGEAEQIRLSMFSFAGDKGANDDGGGGQHGRRGRGRGRGRRRGR